jgi:NADH-quinone oxidoreductase subunit L
MSELAAWLIIGLPLAGGVLAISVVRRLTPGAWRWAGPLTIALVAGAFVLSIVALIAAQDAHGHAVGYEPHRWLAVGGAGGFALSIGVLIDPLSALMATVVTGVSTLVHVFSLGYMRKDADAEGGAYVDYPRYFAYLSLFTAAMLGLVLAHNLIQLFVFWELVGLFSFLLIGFWFHRPAAAAAAKKAFIITRIGDFGLLLGLLYLFTQRGAFLAEGLDPFAIPDLVAHAPELLAGGAATWVALGLFAGAVGKSAQFPLNTWLPDAMEGPTPVSSLIHAATMVAAGVYLVARTFPLFEASDVALNTVALVGGFTALAAAAMGLVATDIKRVLAFSTVSQLGYMFIALGMGGPVVAMFHLFTHAFFKCLLFLGSGSVHHSVHTFDMRHMGGLRAWMPVTYGVMLVGGLALAGVFPLAGFWSKDEVLTIAWEGAHAGSLGVAQAAFWLGLAAAALTAFYVARMLLLTFHGSFRGGIESVPHAERLPDEAHLHVHRHESEPAMLVPMLVLAVLAVGAGLVANAPFDLGIVPAHWFAHLLGEEAPHFNWGIAIASTLTALGGLGLAVLVYGTRTISFDGAPGWWHALGRLLTARYHMDALYETLVVRRLLHRGLFLASDWADRRIVDGVVDLAGWTGRNGGRALSQLQTGQAQAYGLALSTGVMVILLLYLLGR